MSGKFALVVTILLLASACTTMQQGHSPEQAGYSRQNPYLQKIVQWQGRMRREEGGLLQYRELAQWKEEIAARGWNRDSVRMIIDKSKALTSYELEIEDMWDTPREFVARSFQGDCEDIAIFIMANLRLLGYPYAVHVLAVSAAFEDHALIRVQMPDSGWEVFETVPTVGGRDQRLVYTPIVEFDEKEIVSLTL